jgi:hypothetical protein
VKQLVEYLARAVVSAPDEVFVNEVEGESSVLLELSVDPQDLDAIRGPDGETLRAIRTVLSASAGRRKAVLDLVEPSSGAVAPDDLEDADTEDGPSRPDAG